MKAREWQRFFESQLRLESKKVFGVTELGNVAGVSSHALNVELDRLVKRGIIVRYARGKYGLPNAVAPEELLPTLDTGAYITGMYALHRHNLVTQVPVEITCFTNRRHNQSRVRETPLGRFIFTCVNKRIYSPPEKDVITSPEQALCDFVYLACRRSIVPESQVTFRQLEGLDISLVCELSKRYTRSIVKKMYEILAV